jgi:hypothetical protein
MKEMKRRCTWGRLKSCTRGYLHTIALSRKRFGNPERAVKQGVDEVKILMTILKVVYKDSYDRR